MSKGNKGRACTMGKRWRAQSRLARRAFAFAGRVFVAQFRSRCNCTRFFVHPSPRVLCKTVSKDYADDHAGRIKESHVKRKNSWTSKKTLLEEAALFFLFFLRSPFAFQRGTIWKERIWILFWRTNEKAHVRLHLGSLRESQFSFGDTLLSFQRRLSVLFTKGTRLTRSPDRTGSVVAIFFLSYVAWAPPLFTELLHARCTLATNRLTFADCSSTSWPSRPLQSRAPLTRCREQPRLIRSARSARWK